MHLAIMVGKFVKQDVRDWCPSATGPLLLSMTASLLAPGREVLYKRYHAGELSVPKGPGLHRAATAARAKNKKGPQARGACSTFPHEGLLKSANWRPPLHCALNGLGILCPGMCYRCFTILSHAPSGVSTELLLCLTLLWIQCSIMVAV